ncbi:MAG TPA: tetraacyldisaccharide 4'-kinase, partial [Gemmatimonadaceae bacterium]|nr:tetraacyldisaccharide 4'-kinase [Gemmatimonadaceae bacterium]
MTIDAVWYGSTPTSRVLRGLLTPLSWMFGAIVRVRAWLYDAGLLRATAVSIPIVSIGNLTVGGTGKTPVASWLAGRLRARGARPAIVLRGYGDDETIVHGSLEPEVPVVANADRVRGVDEAMARGANVVLLDDAFQHRRVARDHDLVLLSADRGRAHPRLLPAGPAREPWTALRRATLAIVTRRAAGDADVEALCESAAAFLPGGMSGVVVVRLEPAGLCSMLGDESVPLQALDGARVLAVSAIGDPAAFESQLRAAGARVEHAIFPDHHRFDGDDVSRLVQRAAAADRIVCTLKDAVKLGPLWPRAAPPVWYLSQ